MFTSYLDEIRSLKSELQGLKKDIFSLDCFIDHMRKASNIEQTLLDLRVGILYLMEQMKKEPTPQMIGMPVVGTRK